MSILKLKAEIVASSLVMLAVSGVVFKEPLSALVATPMSIMVGTGRGASEGILVRNAEALETMEKVNTLIVDKTGTLTEGKPKVSTIVAAEGIDQARLLQTLSSLEREASIR